MMDDVPWDIVDALAIAGRQRLEAMKAAITQRDGPLAEREARNLAGIAGALGSLLSIASIKPD